MRAFFENGFVIAVTVLFAAGCVDYGGGGEGTDLTSCSRDRDCVLADRGCCCGSGVDDYVAVREDMLSAWRGREECRGVYCPAIACEVPGSIEAVCQEGECAVKTKNEDWYACDTDSDCVKVPADCCGCQNGGGEQAVNRDFEEAYLQELNDACALVDVKCADYDACTTWEAVCHQGGCMTLKEKCGCGNAWDPVCGGTGALMYTFGSECEADCVDMPWHYHGSCNCAVDCDAGLGLQVCADNGVSYWCGEWEAQCNGQTVHYPGECSEECDLCDLLGRPSIPVCSQDFRYYSDMCYAECHDLDWWHQGECLAGEGQVCNVEGSACASDDLFCQTYGCFSCAGTCIAVGSCLEPDDCMGQPLAVDDCLGHWTCPGHTCTWVCY